MELMTRVYTGHSMWPTFLPGDMLEACPPRDIPRPGDVVMFRPMDDRQDGYMVVHRVLAATADGLVTRGDHCRHPDPWRITPSRIIGVVTHLRRHGVRRRVYGGRRGCWIVRRLALSCAARATLRPTLRAVYARLRASGIPARLWQPRVQTLYLESNRGPLVKYLWRGRTIARWWPRYNRFVCRKPFDLFFKRRPS